MTGDNSNVHFKKPGRKNLESFHHKEINEINMLKMV
jgi:hypothetical protein